MKKDFEDIFEEIEDLYHNLYYNNTLGDIEEVEKQLSKIIGTKMVCYDTTIDDGMSYKWMCSCGDEYIMKSSFSSDDDKIIVSFYYGNNSNIVTYYTINLYS